MTFVEEESIKLSIDNKHKTKGKKSSSNSYKETKTRAYEAIIRQIEKSG